jgi:hypothetical protein
MERKPDIYPEDFLLGIPRKQSYETDISSSNAPLGEKLRNLLKPKNIRRIAGSAELSQEYYAFLGRMYHSEENYFLTAVLQEKLKSKYPEVRYLGYESFMEVLGFMGFEPDESQFLLWSWSQGMEMEGDEGDPNNIMINALEKHFFQIMEVERFERGGFHRLYRDFGIANAQRYWGRNLKFILEGLKNPGRNYIQGILATGDHNSAMMGRDVLSDFIFDLAGQTPYKSIQVPFRPIEAGNHKELLKRKKTLKEMFGAGKVMAYYVFAHSDATQMGLSKMAVSKVEHLTFEDIKRLDVFGKTWNEHVKNPVIILDACSTGQEIARQISAYLSATVYAPLVPSSIKRIVVSKERDPKITDVIYRNKSVVYQNGKAIRYKAAWE